VNWLNTSTVAAGTASQPATCEDFRKLFTEDVHGLHLLSFLLTADHEKAERCFVAGLDECVDGDSVFKEWARPWARRMIVRNALQMISHHQHHVHSVRLAKRTWQRLLWKTARLRESSL
jgi:hypothetical protein